MLFTLLGTAQDDDKYTQTMLGTLQKMDTCESTESFTQVANQFARIAGAETDKWLPNYWTAYCYALVGMMGDDPTKVDEVLDLAQEYIDVADSLDPSNSEVYVVKAFILSGRIMVDPMNRGMVYGMQSSQATAQAIAFDENNPRAYFFKGSSLFYTPEMYGGGKEKAQPELETSVSLFETFEPESELHPNWGREQAEELLGQCEE